MHKLTKPAALAVGVAAVIISMGTGYAAIKWLQPHSTIDTNSIVTLPNGNKRIKIHHESCQGQDQNEPGDSYYEIKAGSNVTPEQLRAGLEAMCEDDLLETLFPKAVYGESRNESGNKKLAPPFKPGDKQYQFPYVQLKEIGKDYIVTESHLNGRTYPATRLPIDTNATFYSKGNPIRLSDLKPGDWVTLVSYTTALDKPYSTETMFPDELEKISQDGFPIGTRLEGMIKRQYNPESSMQLMGVMGEDWTRLEQDKNSPDGWRQIVPFDHDWDKYKQQFENQ